MASNWIILFCAREGCPAGKAFKKTPISDPNKRSESAGRRGQTYSIIWSKNTFFFLYPFKRVLFSFVFVSGLHAGLLSGPYTILPLKNCSLYFNLTFSVIIHGNLFFSRRGGTFIQSIIAVDYFHSFCDRFEAWEWYYLQLLLYAYMTNVMWRRSRPIEHYKLWNYSLLSKCQLTKRITNSAVRMYIKFKPQLS